MVKDKLFTMKMSEEEKEWLEELAHYRGHSIASYFIDLATEDAQKVGVKIPKEAWNRRGHAFTPANKEMNFYLNDNAKDKVYTKTKIDEENDVY